jgi:hypothetical protein
LGKKAEPEGKSIAARRNIEQGNVSCRMKNCIKELIHYKQSCTFSHCSFPPESHADKFPEHDCTWPKTAGDVLIYRFAEKSLQHHFEY